MIIQHNIPALNALRNKTNNSNALNKNLEKLSSGYRINRAADDAAGLAISEKMRAQVSGLTQAKLNAEDGISLVQTAEGAMQEIHTMMDRMMTLAVQSANGTYSDENRAAMQGEIEQLMGEVTRIREGCNFNSLPLLQGNEAAVTSQTPPTIKGGLPAWVKTEPALTDVKESLSENKPYTTTVTFTDDMGNSMPVQINHVAAYVDFSDLGSPLSADKYKELLEPDTGIFTTCCTCSNHYSIKFVDEQSSSMEKSGTHYIYKIGINGITSAEELVERVINGTQNGNPQGHYTKLTVDPSNPTELIIYDDRSMEANPKQGVAGTWSDWDVDNRYFNTKPSGDNGIFGKGIAYAPVSNTDTVSDIVLHIGETGDDNNSLKIDLPDMALDKIGIGTISVDPADSAKQAIDMINGGIDYVSSERSRMGAYQNRLEHTINNLSVQTENITASESRIRDLDMAKEMMAYTKNNILGQASQAMLAQANMVPQGVLQLLQ